MNKSLLLSVLSGVLLGGSAVYAASSVFSAKVTGTITVVSTTTDPAAILALTNVTANGVACSVSNPTTASCPAFSVNEGKTAPMSIVICNTGNLGVAPTVTGTTTLQGSSIVAAQPSLPVFAGGCNTWSLTYTAPTNAFGTDSITIMATA